MKPRICVVGSINMDLVFRTPRMPVAGETISGHEFLQIAGGKGANQAVAAARAGAAVSMIACIGDDSYGQQSLQGLQSDSINCDHIQTIPACATGVAGIFVDDQGRNSIVIAPGANAHVSPAQITVASHAISGAQLLICQCETPLDSVIYAIGLATQHGIIVVFNPAPALALSDELLAQVHYLIVNETEARQLSGIAVTNLATAQQASDHLRQRGASCVLLTMGEQGVMITDSNQSRHLAAIRVQAVDTTAAGDTFVGAFATALCQGLSPIDAAQRAQYAAALTVTRLGAQSSIPDRAAVEQFIAQRSAVS